MSSNLRPVSDRLEDRVLRIVADLVGELRGQDPSRGIGFGDSLERDLGISSLERVELLIRLERVFGVRLGDVVMSEAETPGDLATAILTANPDVTETWSDTRPDPTIIIPAPSTALTIVDALEWHAERTPDRVHIYLREDDGQETPLTYGDVWREATDVANNLVDRGLGRRDAVALMLRTERAFFSAFFGILMAGCVPVPMYPPFRADRIEDYAQRQVRILRNADAKLMITFAEVERIATLLTGQAPSLESILTVNRLTGGDHEPVALPSRHRLPSRQDDREPALIQYTSGSTGQPKGVLLSHANLLANIRALATRLEVGADDVGVSWLPLYHDMGLIGTWLGTLYVGSPLALMSPLAFLARPARWLWSLHAHRGTFSAAPNFAYDLCSHRIDDAELEGLDLGAVRVLLNGAEAVRPETLARFIKRFEPWGLNPKALAPVYGLAECSVGLSVPPAGRGPLIDSIQRRQFQKRAELVPAVKTTEACCSSSHADVRFRTTRFASSTRRDTAWPTGSRDVSSSADRPRPRAITATPTPPEHWWAPTDGWRRETSGISAAESCSSRDDGRTSSSRRVATCSPTRPRRWSRELRASGRAAWRPSEFQTRPVEPSGSSSSPKPA